MAHFVTFGEIMLRLKSPGYERLMQSGRFEATFGGAEANVAVSLANFGMDARFVSALPDNTIADACIRELKGFGVDTAYILRRPGRMGVYYLESGAVQRAGKVIYDRDNSVMAAARPGDFDWPQMFAGAEWFHTTGITPAISQSAADLAVQGVKAAKEAGLKVSIDLNYRKNLWNWGKKAHEVMPLMVQHADTIIANEEDVQKALHISTHSADDAESGELNVEGYREICHEVMQAYPNLKHIAITLRESKSASHNDWSGCLMSGSDFFVSRKYAITDIVDRVGGGDSFSGGLIYGLTHYGDQDALEFAVAASCLKHTIMGDYNRFSVKDVEALMRGSGSGRVQR